MSYGMIESPNLNSPNNHDIQAHFNSGQQEAAQQQSSNVYINENYENDPD